MTCPTLETTGTSQLKELRELMGWWGGTVERVIVGHLLMWRMVSSLLYKFGSQWMIWGKFSADC